MTVILIRALGDESFGQWSTVLVVLQITSYLAELGLEMAAVRLVATDVDDEGGVLGSLVVLRLLLAIPTAAAMGLLVALLASNDAMRVAGWIAASSILITALGAGRATFQTHVRNDIPVFLASVNVMIWGAGVVALGDGPSVVAVSILYVVATSVTIAAQAFMVRRFVRLRFDRVSVYRRRLLTVGAPVGLGSLLIVSYAKVDQVLVFNIAGDHAASMYGAAYRLLDQGRLVPLSLLATLFPLMAKAFRTDRRRLTDLVQAGFDYCNAISFPALAVGAVASTEVVDILFGAEFADSAVVIFPLMLGLVVASYALLASNVLVVIGEERRLVTFGALGLLLNVVANVALIPPFGFAAAAWITVLTEVLVTVGYCSVIRRHVEISLHLGPTTIMLAAAVGMGLIIWTLNSANVSFWVAVPASIGFYAATVLGTKAVSPPTFLRR